MTLEELFNLPDGKYKAILEDLSSYDYQMSIESDRGFSKNNLFKKWVEIKLSCPRYIHDIFYITKSDTGIVLFSTGAVDGLNLATSTPPSWFEYFKIKE